MKPHKLSFKITIPPEVKFSDLHLSRNSETGAVEFDWTPIEKICAASGVDIHLLREQHEDNVAGLITVWYFEHRQLGGEPDPVQEELIEEMRLEDERGVGLSHPPGRA
jgi:hypothetical protein